LPEEINSKPFFSTRIDYTTYLLYLSAYKAKFQFRLYAYALIHNDTVLKKTLEALERELTRGRKIKYLYFNNSA